MTHPFASPRVPATASPARDSVRLFGTPALHLAGADEEVPIDWSKGAALVAYLACRPGWHARETVAQMLRPDADASTSRAYLRRLIHRARQSLPVLSALQVDEERIRWTGDSDVATFTTAVEAGDWDRAIALQPAPLLDGVPSSGLPALDDWIFEERSRLRQGLRGALVARIVQGHERAEDCAALMRRLAEEDPVDESGVQFLLVQARTPVERHVAAAAYETLKRRLENELGQQPLAETVTLVDRLQAGAVAAASPSREAAAPAPVMPPPPESLIGRDAELGQLAGKLLRAEVRLLTIFGFGGVGKTLLARTLHERLRAEGCTCAWVDLLAADSLNTMLDAIASHLGMPTRDQSVEEHLAAWLAERRLVVFLDNFEQLIPHAPVLAGLLARAPAVQFVLTSREALRLPVEHAFRLEGLASEGAASPAARLFALHAGRAGYRVTDRDSADVAGIVACLDGLPLAIELAAHWTTLLSPAGILAEIARDPAFIDGASGARGGARTMQSVLAAAWRRLDTTEQDALGTLAVFLGPVELEEARAVGDTEPRVLLRLVDKSLLHRAGTRGFRLHPLLRDFVKAQARPEVIAAARERHMLHFLGAVAALPALHVGCSMPPQAQALAGQVEDILKAWRLGADQQRTALLASALPNLSVLLLMASRHEEAARVSAETADRVPFEPLGAMLAGLHATAAFRLGRMEDVRAVAESALRRGAKGAARVWLELALARVDWFSSDYDQSLLHAEAAVAALPPDDPYLRMMALLDLGNSRYGHGQLEAARAGLAESLSLARRHGARHWEGRALAYLGVVCSASRDTDEALEFLAAALAIFRELDAAHDLAFTLRCTSYALFLKGDSARQLESAQAALDAFRAAGYYHELGESQFALALALQMNGRAGEALPRYHEALTRCVQASNVSGALRCIAMLGALAIAEDRRWGAALASFAFRHPGIRRPDRQELHAMFTRLGVTPEEFAQAEGDAAGWTLDDVCGRLLERFAARKAAGGA